MQRVLAAAAAVCLLTAAGACNIPIGVDLRSQECCTPGGGGPFEMPLSLTATENIVSGEMMDVAAYSTLNIDHLDWSLTGPAVLVIGVDSAIRVSDMRQVSVRGTGTGAVRLKVVTGFGDSAVAEFFAARAEDVTLRIGQVKDLRLPIGNEMWIEPLLRDAAGRVYRGTLEWTSSDTTRVVIRRDGNLAHQARFVRGVGAGRANVIVGFRSQRDTLRVEVVP
jgi:hypothetical protein